METISTNTWLVYTIAAGVIWLATVEKEEQPGKRIPWWKRDGIFALGALLLLVVGGWEIITWDKAIDLDESLFAVGAKRLLENPVFWRDLDGYSSGPLNYYILLPLQGIGYLDHRGIRLVAAGLLAATAWIGIKIVRGRTWAQRLPIAGVLIIISTSGHVSFQTYNSELVSLPILAAAMWLLNKRTQWKGALLLGTLLGLIPYAKLHGIILGGFIGMAAMASYIEESQRNPQPIGNRPLLP
jgi:hypothetical protein